MRNRLTHKLYILNILVAVLFFGNVVSADESDSSRKEGAKVILDHYSFDVKEGYQLPKAGCVPDERTAITVARAIFEAPRNRYHLLSERHNYWNLCEVTLNLVARCDEDL